MVSGSSTLWKGSAEMPLEGRQSAVKFMHRAYARCCSQYCTLFLHNAGVAYGCQTEVLT